MVFKLVATFQQQQTLSEQKEREGNRTGRKQGHERFRVKGEVVEEDKLETKKADMLVAADQQQRKEDT